MKRDVQSIPPAPRNVRWSLVFAFRWPLALIAIILGGYFGVWTWMLLLAHGGAVGDDERLDTGNVVRVEGKVLLLRPERGTIQGEPAEVVDYEFRYGMPGSPEPTTWKGASFARAGQFQRDQLVTVQLLAAEPNRSRIVGARANLTPATVSPTLWLWILVLPGFGFGIVYLLGVLHLRRILVHGDVGIAAILRVRKVPFVLPEMWMVQFRFRDRHANELTSQHWVRAHSRLGARLRRAADGSGESIPVLHERNAPKRCRLVLPEDFPTAPQPTGNAPSLRS
jgi:hypothetical protein